MNDETVLILSYYFPPMGMGGTQRSAKFAKYLSLFGWKPVVITVKNVHYYAYDDSLLNEIQHVEIVRTESLDPLRLLARFKKSRAKPSTESSRKSSKSIFDFINKWLFVPDNKILWLPFALFKSLIIIRKRGVKVVFTTSPPQSAHIAGLILKILTRVKWVADFRDDWTGGESQPCPSRFHLFISQFLEKRILKSADCVVAMCDHLSQSLHKKSGQDRNKFITIMNGYDPDDFRPILDTPLNMTFTITHCGSISKVSDPEPFLIAVRHLFNNHPNLVGKIKIRFIGTDIFGKLAQLVNELNLEQIITPIEYLPHQQALHQIMSSHLLLITVFKKTDEEIITGKIFEYLGSGKKILMISGDGFVARLITKLQRGVVIENSDIEGIENAIYEYYQQHRRGTFVLAEPLEATEFDRKEQTGQLATIFASLTT